ncbi:MAG TPA: DUF1236 domain-containing protein [Bradyrhizobium sp.]|nr:DUF1236 domain-containing protein [Bradyrhizobium sp.]
MTNRFTTSVAAIALIAGTSFAYAQGTGASHEGSSGSAAQQSAPASGHGGGSATQMNHNEAAPHATTGQSGDKAQSGQRAQDEPKAGANQEKSAQENSAKGERSKTMSSENDKAKGGKEMKAEGREDRSGKKAEGREDRSKMKAEGREGREDRNNMKAEGREDRGNMKAEGREDRGNMKAEGREGRNGAESKTVGQAGAGAKLSTEQRTKITSVFREQHVAPLTNANFAISVGTRVPRDISFHALPAEIVTIYPEWRGYEFVRVRDQIVVVDPNTFEIVAVLEA